MIDPFSTSGDSVQYVGLPIIHKDESKMQDVLLSDSETKVKGTGHTFSFVPSEFNFDIEPDGTEILRKFSEKWGVVSDLENSTVQSVDTEIALKRETRLMAVEEKHLTETLPESEAVSIVDDAVPISRRYDHLPAKPEELTITFSEEEIEPYGCHQCGGSGKLRCPTCSGSGEITCSTCGGSGSVSCPDCGGNGTVPDGEGGTQPCRTCGQTGTVNCTDCNGTGSTQCSQCSGSGNVVCSTCNGDGTLAELQHGVFDVTVQSYDAVFSDLVSEEKVLEGPMGDLLYENVVNIGSPSPGEKITTMEETAVYGIPVVQVQYEYDGEEYAVDNIGGEVSSTNSRYPKTTKRKLLPYALAALGIIIVAGLYVYFVGSPI